MLKFLLFIFIISVSSCIEDEMNKAAKECKSVCDSMINDKAAEIEESIDKYCLTQDELIDFLSDLNYTELFDRITQMREEECKSIPEN